MSKKTIVGLIILQATLFQMGCKSYEPTELPSDQPVPPGPGLLTGDKGYFEVEVGRSGIKSTN